MTEWAFEKATLMKDLEDTQDRLTHVLKNPRIWHRVRQSAVRALEQIEVAQVQLDEQEYPL